MKLQRKINYELEILLEKATSIECKDLHHSQNQYHKQDEVCPIEYKLAKYAYNVREYIAQLHPQA
jgi:hypothetical protein